MATDEGAQRATLVLRRVAQGDKPALDELLPLVYDQLRDIARDQLARERPGHTLQSTALVHEAYLRLIDQRQVDHTDRAHFFAAAAAMIRRILVDHARGRNRLKRGGGRERVSIETVEIPAPAGVDVESLDTALAELARESERAARVVELRFFGGLSVEQVADVIGVSPRTVASEWVTARAWLKRALERGFVKEN